MEWGNFESQSLTSGCHTTEDFMDTALKSERKPIVESNKSEMTVSSAMNSRIQSNQLSTYIPAVTPLNNNHPRKSQRDTHQSLL